MVAAKFVVFRFKSFKNGKLWFCFSFAQATSYNSFLLPSAPGFCYSKYTVSSSIPSLSRLPSNPSRCSFVFPKHLSLVIPLSSSYFHGDHVSQVFLFLWRIPERSSFKRESSTLPCASRCFSPGYVNCLCCFYDREDISWQKGMGETYGSSDTARKLRETTGRAENKIHNSRHVSAACSLPLSPTFHNSSHQSILIQNSVMD